jgi:hypothetical protein
MYRISQNKRKYSTTPVVRVEVDKQGKEKEVQVLFSCLPKKEGDAFMEELVNFLNKKS